MGNVGAYPVEDSVIICDGKVSCQGAQLRTLTQEELVDAGVLSEAGSTTVGDFCMKMQPGFSLAQYGPPHVVVDEKGAAKKVKMKPMARIQNHKGHGRLLKWNIDRQEKKKNGK